MAIPEHIRDLDDPRLAPYLALRDAHLRSARGMVPEPMFIAEGLEVVRTLLRSSFSIHSLLLTPSRFEDLAGEISRRSPSPDVLIAERDTMQRITGFDVHRGVLAAGLRGEPQDPERVAGDCRRLVILEAISNHDNVGAIFRGAACLWGQSCGVLLSPGCCDPLYRKSIRVSMGAVLRLPFATLTPWPDALADLRERRGWEIAALTPAQGAISVEDYQPSARARVAIVVGAEGAGLTAGALTAASVRARIPMQEGADSLNVATAAAIAMHVIENKTASRASVL